MFCTHVYFNGNCQEVIELYKKAFGAEVLTIIPNQTSGKENEVIHSEIKIHDQTLMMNDFGDNEGITKSSGFQLVVQFQSIEQLEESFSILSENGIIIFPKQPTDYSECVVRFIDKFGVTWGMTV
ncbi:MAG: VOC family protein [Anaerolinea sp.]|nr:VOC family protein [Anaerolinea sp.]